MNQSPILSLCIPTYNRANILEKTISRIVSCRSFDSDVELVISDNCSTDNTRQVCEHFAAKYDNVKYNPPITYLSADEWVSYINERDVYILDCRDGSLLGLTPFVQ